MKDLCILPAIAMEAWKQVLASFAHQYSCTEIEIEEGIQKGLGRIFEGAGHYDSPRITLAHLVEIFTGYKDALPVTPTYVAAYSSDQITRFVRSHHLHPHIPSPSPEKTS